MGVSRSLLLALLLSFLSPVGFSRAQYMFLDANGDGSRDLDDRLDAADATTVDIWVQTDANRDGSRPACISKSTVPVSIFSYEFILHASGGTVEWGLYKNALPTMNFMFGELRSSTDFYTGYSGDAPLQPGKYKLGTLTVRVLSGSPTIRFASRAPLWHWVGTDFGSMNPGKDGDYTLKFTEDVSQLGSPISDVPGDWGDADGLGGIGVNLAGKGSALAADHFGISVSPNPMNPGAAFVVSTTRPGFLRIRLFDVGGRLVKTLVDMKAMASGSHRVLLTSVERPHERLSSGVYFYRVEAEEGVLSGRIVVAK